MNTVFRGLAVFLCIVIFLCSCGGSRIESPESSAPVSAPVEEQSWPVALPQDQQLPWEELDSSGKVIPQRSVLSFDASSNFTRGADFDSSGGTVAPSSQGANIKAGASGAKQMSYGVYRVPTGGVQPGAVSVDANLRPQNGGAPRPSSYYLGLADYANNRWQWRGPYSDSHVRVSAASGVAAGSSYTSPLGNVFVAIVAYDGAELDVVGITLDTLDGADTTAPPAPAALGVTPKTGGFLLQWTPSVAADLAGYRIYYSNASFSATTDPGLSTVNYLEGTTQHSFSQPAGGPRFFGITAVDANGNESALSNVASASVTAGSKLELIVETDVIAGALNSPATLSVSGADNYDFDLDGDGVYEITGSTTTSQTIDTGNTGIIRPGVRGNSSGGAVALGGVSLLVSAGFPPVAMLDSDLSSGVLWDEDVTVNFDASASSDADSASLEYSFDPEGDGTFNAYSANPLRQKIYTAAGNKMASVLVRDPDGYIDQAYRLVRVYQAGGFDVTYPHPKSNVGQYNSLALVNGKPAIVYVDGNTSSVTYVRAKDSRGTLWNKPVLLEANASVFCSLAVIKGNPAVAYWRNSDSHLRYIRCANTDGDTLAAWSNAPADLGGPFGVMEKVDLCEVNGNPALVYVNGGKLYYIRATTAAGTGNSTGDWANAPFELEGSGTVGINPQLELISGQPAVAYLDAGPVVKYKRATNATGASALDWPGAAVTISGTSGPSNFIGLKEISGAPAVIWFDSPSGFLQYVRSTSSDGALLADWPLPVDLTSTPGAGQFCSLASIGGHPAVLYEDTSWGITKRYRRATNSTGSAWGPEYVIGRQGGQNDYGQWCCLAEINGLPAASVYYLGGSSIAFAYTSLE